jgi:carbamoyl-phosphate synthase small subunit
MTSSPYPPGYLLLEDGRTFDGVMVGAGGVAVGEVVFNTSMTGYQEILTDPSYAGQIITMTAPQIGNYGVTPEDEESGRVQVAGFVVRELSPMTTGWRARSRSRPTCAGAAS